jgi:acetyl/propionyl-CoA carboxylase alpha subunit
VRLLIANRAEIAVRIAQAATELGLETVAVYSEDDAGALHAVRASRAHALAGRGAAAYLDVEQIVKAAVETGCDALHPGYGFLSEQPALAARCRAAGVTFVGPDAATLATLGDKVAARALAARLGVPVLRGTAASATEADVTALLGALPPGTGVVIKAVAGGGGRGMRVVHDPRAVSEAYARCRSEAAAAFGIDAVYAEEYLPRARHVEIQILGDGSGAVTHLYDRECSIQRRHQKLIEIAPALPLPEALRRRMHADAVRMAAELRYASAGTFEMLVAAGDDGASRHVFIEANARLQVEHTVTEETLGIDLVKAQLRLAGGASLAELGLTQKDVPAPRGYAIQSRINLERIAPDGTVRPSSGTLVALRMPSGRGVRVDTAARTGDIANPSFDSLFAKIIAHAPGTFSDAVAVASRAVAELSVAGVDTNRALLLAVLRHPAFVAGDIDTSFLERHREALLAALDSESPAHASTHASQHIGARVDALDPLAVLDYGRGAAPSDGRISAPAVAAPQADVVVPSGAAAIRAPMQALIVRIEVAAGDAVVAGAPLAILSAMKMEHVIDAPSAGVVRAILASAGDTVAEGAPLFAFEAQVGTEAARAEPSEAELYAVRPDLAEVMRRRALTDDPSRHMAAASMHARGRRTARENVADLCDGDSFVQYGSLVVGQSLRGTVDELLDYAPSDGLVMGLGCINRARFGPTRSRCVVMAYDYSVLAGTQGGMNHRMMDRMLDTAEKLSVPVVLFAEGGGGRAGGGSRNPDARRTSGAPDAPGRAGGASSDPSDRDAPDAAGHAVRSSDAGASASDPAHGTRMAAGDARRDASSATPAPITGGGGLNTPSWTKLARLSALVPLVGIVSGRCFAGNAALLGCCDVIIATPDATLGMAGPAMIEGGGLGVYRPDEVGPVAVQTRSGVIDLVAQDEASAVELAKRYLAYFQGPVVEWTCADQRWLRGAVPENRLRVYDIRRTLRILADEESVMEVRADFGAAMITVLARLEGRTIGIVANNPLHLSGAIDSPAADKAARFLQLCDAFDIPVLFLCDTPGIMVGPDHEATGLVRHASRMFVIGASLTVPVFTVVLRKSYGLGAQTMGGGNHRVPIFTVSWPTGEFGGMGLEGQVKLGRRRELEQIQDPALRRARYAQMVEEAYERGRGLNAAHVFEVDDVIDPADTRRWLIAGLDASPPPTPRAGKKRPCIDPW